MERALNQGIGALETEAGEQTHRIVTYFETFRRRWAQDAGDVQANLESAADFFARLERLERDGLPAHEARFFDMLRTQSGQNLVALQQYIAQAHKAIRARMEDVNAIQRSHTPSKDESRERQLLVNLSKEFGLLCSLTTFIAIEHRSLEERNEGRPALRQTEQQARKTIFPV